MIVGSPCPGSTPSARALRCRPTTSSPISPWPCPLLLLTSACSSAGHPHPLDDVTYVGVVGFMVLWLLHRHGRPGKPGVRKAAAWFEPLGMAALTWPPSTGPPPSATAPCRPLTGPLLANRMFILSLSAGVPALAYWALPLRVGRRGRARSVAAPRPPSPPRRPRRSRARCRVRASTRATAWPPSSRPARGSTWARCSRARPISCCWAWGCSTPWSACGSSTDAGRYGGVIYPVTRALIPCWGSFSLIPMIIAIYYAGELVWRERERKTHEIVDATPCRTGPSWPPRPWPSPGLGLDPAGQRLRRLIVSQWSTAISSFELDKYLLWYVLPQAVDFILWPCWRCSCSRSARTSSSAGA
jgi:ABC-2 type transport system permease protein